jgi:type I restriction enzyme S subunit
VRTANVKSGKLVFDGARYTDEAGWQEWTARGVPSAGDVIFTREAPAGEACLVPEGMALCIGQRTVLLRPNRSIIDGEWIVHSIYSGAAQRFIEVLAKSTTVAHINMSDIPDIPVVVPPLQEQKSVLTTVRREVSRLAGLKEKLSCQIELLREHRQALITAAVTGDLKIPEVAA